MISGDLRRHYIQHHGHPHSLLECHHCNKVFATHKCLVKHQQTHKCDVKMNTSNTNSTNDPF